MAKRLGSPVRFRGRSIDTRPGESLTRALVRHRVRFVQRSIRYHRARAPFCGVGYCTNCLVRVNGTPNVRACRYEPGEGDRVETENAWPSPTFDLLGALDGVFFRGIDTLHGFTWPAWAVPLYQRVVRRLAGYGTLADLRAPPNVPVPIELDARTLIVGAGAAGRSAALGLAETEPNLVVLDRARGVAPIPGATVLEGTTAVFLPPPQGPAERPFVLLGARDDGTAVRVRASRIVLAPGGYDASLLFEGNDRPGVLTAEGAYALAAPDEPPPFRRAVLVGAGPRTAEFLDRWGDHVEALVGLGAVGPDVVRRASELEVPIYPRTLVLKASGARGVRSVDLAPRGGGRAFRLACDAVILAHRRLPNPQLFFQAGASMRWHGETGAYYPTLSDGGATTVPCLFAAGEAAGFVGASAEPSGRAVSDSLRGSGVPTSLERVAAGRPNELEGYYRELLARPKSRGKTIACPCEDVLLSELKEASGRGYRGIEVLKRYTGAGTGLCQGRYCLPDLLLLLSIWEQRAPSEVGFITQRPPVVPTSLGTLATLADDLAVEAP